MSAIFSCSEQTKTRQDVIKVCNIIRSYLCLKASLSLLDLAGVKPYQPKKVKNI